MDSAEDAKIKVHHSSHTVFARLQCRHPLIATKNFQVSDIPMPIKVACGNCRKHFAAPDRLAGKTVACPECRSPIEITLPEPVQSTVDDLLDDVIAATATAVPAANTVGLDSKASLPVAKARSRGDAHTLKWFFSFDGRIPRSRFWLYWGGGMSILALLGGLVQAGGIPDAIPVIVFWLLFGPLIAMQVKRWHDLDKSGAWVLINFIPFVGLLFALVMLGCVRGTNGANQYGRDPLR